MFILFKEDRSCCTDLLNSVFKYWLQWFCILLIATLWLVLTFFVNENGCPKGYLGPGGKHHHGQYENCTGGKEQNDDV
jgi:heparan-alpha-glucosaminide N-acetyltransferase